MFRQAASILLLVIVAIQISGKWLVLADYTLNKEFIARTLCENKSKPALKCQGKCHLRKQLQKEENGGEQSSQRSSQQKFQEVVFDVTAFVAPEPAMPLVNINKTSNTILYTFRYTSSIFHPPGVAVHQL